MSQQMWTNVDRYLTDLFVPSDPVLDAVLAASEAAGLPSINVSPTQGKLLMLMGQVVGARSILEVGTLGGYSAIWLARGLSPGGYLITLESDEKYAAVARANFSRASLSGVVDLRLGPALGTLPAIAAEGKGPFDLIFIDGDRPHYPEYFEWALKLARPGTLIITDNVVRDGAVTDPSSSDTGVQGVRRFNQAAATESRAVTTAIQIVSPKGHDGFAISRVKGGRKLRTEN
jgi:predicted O-methyltransferase YrrM